MKKRIYRLTNKGNGTVTLVRATSEAHALKAMAMERWDIYPATQDDCMEYGSQPFGHGGGKGVFDAPVIPRKKRDAVDQFLRDAGEIVTPLDANYPKKKSSCG